jgi:heat-inducible transcriptional repressor
MAPRVEHLRMRTLHLVAVADQRVLAILVTETGGVVRRIFDFPERLTSRELEQAAGILARRVAGRTLNSLRRQLEQERERLRGEADRWLHRVWALGMQTWESEEGSEGEDLVIATRIALFDQPEFSDPERVRGLFAALETNQKLLGLLRQLASADTGLAQVGWSVSLGQILGEPSLSDCALVAMPYGSLPAKDRRLGMAARGRGADRYGSDAGASEPGREDGSLGVLGVIGPQRMDYGRVIPLVSYCAELVTRKLLA